MPPLQDNSSVQARCPMSHHRVGVTDYQLTERERYLVWLANQDLGLRNDGFFRIDWHCLGCDHCGSRLPHNGKAQTHGNNQRVTDMIIDDEDEIVCRLCASGKSDDNMTGQIEAAMNAVEAKQAMTMMEKAMKLLRRR